MQRDPVNGMSPDDPLFPAGPSRPTSAQFFESLSLSDSEQDPWNEHGRAAALSPAEVPPAGAHQRDQRTGFDADKKRIDTSEVPLVLGVAVVDFNHLIGPTVEFAYPPVLEKAIQDDEDLNRLLPFLALPDGAHLSEEDYSYFHCVYKPSPDVPSSSAIPSNTTLFGISCNRQLAAVDLLVRPDDVTRSTVQKAVVVIASQPVFGPIRDKLGVVTRAFFAQRDFTQTDILKDFYSSLQDNLMDKADEVVIAMGTSLRELVHKFRHRTLILLKMLMLQKRVMLYGYPVEMLCTYQYSLLSLMPGLLLELQDAGSPDLDIRRRRERPTSFKSSDRRSLLRYMGLPLHLFAKDAFFQPYLPLQQVDMLYAKSWLVGTTNQIVTQQRDGKYDLLVNIDTMTFEFTDPKLERIVSLTPADRKWMDDVVRTVEETWEVPEGQRSSFKGSDDDLRSRFEEYICGALAAIKLEDFVKKGKQQDVAIIGIGAESAVLAPFSEAWLKEFKTTAAYDIWNACTDAVLFDICEPKHPCDGPVNAVSDIGLRLTEGLHDLKLDQQFAPARDAVTSAFTAGSSTLFRAFDGVRNEVSTRLKEREDAEKARRLANANGSPSVGASETAAPARGGVAIPIQAPQMAEVRATLGSIGTGIGSFFGSRVASFRGPTPPTQPASPPSSAGLRPMSLAGSISDRKPVNRNRP